MLSKADILRDEEECSLKIIPDLIYVVGLITYSKRAGDVLKRLHQNSAIPGYREHEGNIVNGYILPRVIMLALWNAAPVIAGLEALTK